MRADRLLSILMLLQVQGRMTAAQLARELEVSPRTILRDMEALSSAGVPVVADRGTGGGWSLLGDYQTDLTGMNEQELLTLFLPQSGQVLADLGLEEASKKVFWKLLASLPGRLRHNAQDVGQRIHIDTTGWSRFERGQELIPLLQKAIWEERKLWFRYQRGDGTKSERVIDPLGLVAEGNVWYLVGHAEGEYRTYRVSRMEGAEVTEERSTRPAGFDLPAYWAESAGKFAAAIVRYPVTLRANQTTFSRMRNWRFTRFVSEPVPDGDGWCTVRMEFDAKWVACEYVLGLGNEVVIVEPAELREEVIAKAREVVRMYEGAAGVAKASET